MSFIVFMICMLAAIFFGMVLDRVMVLSKKARETEDEDEVYEFYDVGFPNKDILDSVLEHMKVAIERNGFVRVYDLYLLCGAAASKTDFKYGWKDISKFEIVETSEKLLLKPSEPCELEK